MQNGMNNGARAVLLCLALPLAACSYATGSAAGEEVVFGNTSVCLGAVSHPFPVEVAATEAQRQRGLMGRDSLEEGTGMWFQYPDEATPKYGFWMYSVPFPLEVAFINAAGEVVDILAMAPCVGVPARQCPAYRTREPYLTALELNPGVLKAHGVVRGSTISEAQQGVCPGQASSLKTD